MTKEEQQRRDFEQQVALNNRCDGCARGLPVGSTDGYHYTVDSFNSPLRAGLCTAKREEGTAAVLPLSQYLRSTGEEGAAQRVEALERELTDLRHDMERLMKADSEHLGDIAERDALLREALGYLDKSLPDTARRELADDVNLAERIRRTLEGKS